MINFLTRISTIGTNVTPVTETENGFLITSLYVISMLLLVGGGFFYIFKGLKKGSSK